MTTIQRFHCSNLEYISIAKHSARKGSKDILVTEGGGLGTRLWYYVLWEVGGGDKATWLYSVSCVHKQCDINVSPKGSVCTHVPTPFHKRCSTHTSL